MNQSELVNNIMDLLSEGLTETEFEHYKTGIKPSLGQLIGLMASDPTMDTNSLIYVLINAATDDGPLINPEEIPTIFDN